MQELAEHLAEPLQQSISLKFFAGAPQLAALQHAPVPTGQPAADSQMPAANAAPPAALARQLAEARQAAADSVKVRIPPARRHRLLVIVMIFAMNIAF